MSGWEVFLQQLIIGLSNGMIIALIALGYTMVYGIIELINFAHGDLFMLGCFCALTLVGALGLESAPAVLILLAIVPVFSGGLNWLVDRLAYRHLREATKLAPLVSAIGVSFVFLNLGVFWGGLAKGGVWMGKGPGRPEGFSGLVFHGNVLGNA